MNTHHKAIEKAKGKPKYHSTPGAAKYAVYSKDLRSSDPTAWAKHHMRKEREGLTRYGKEVLARMK